jgi:hypothetical protein
MIAFSELERSLVIATLNDNLRTTFTGGLVTLTASVVALSQEVRAEVLRRVREFNNFGDWLSRDESSPTSMVGVRLTHLPANQMRR